MDDDRKRWLDKLIKFMEEKRPSISVNLTKLNHSLDLYTLYMLVKERGGFVEVTKNQNWKDIGGLLGIGSSSSVAYTLRKSYTTNLLAFECHFDRDDIDVLIEQLHSSEI